MTAAEVRSLRRRITRPCHGCGGKRTCYWDIDAWTCRRCGDEWYPDHGGEYADPSESDEIPSRPAGAGDLQPGAGGDAG